MKIREPIRLVIMYSDRPAIKRGRQSYISAQPAVFFSFFFPGEVERSAVGPDTLSWKGHFLRSITARYQFRGADRCEVDGSIFPCEKFLPTRI